MSAPTSASRTGELKSKPEPAILFQKFFKSVGPRTYVSQIKEAGNGDQFLVLTEGRRDEKTNEVRKARLLVFSQDFPAFFRLLHQTGSVHQSQSRLGGASAEATAILGEEGRRGE